MDFFKETHILRSKCRKSRTIPMISEQKDGNNND